MTPRETENNAYAKFWSDQQTVLWPDDVSGIFWSGQLKFTLALVVATRVRIKFLDSQENLSI